jgi:DNA-binding transcriptional LysR family regulator
MAALCGKTAMNLRAVDLQLLVALDVLLQELHVTRAARSLGLSQPAMSHMLARLRGLFGDPLLVRTTSGLAPTARALELREPVRDALRHVRMVFDAGTAFDPQTSLESFVVRMGDMNEFLVLPSVARELEKSAPGISLEIRHLPPLETVRALDADEIHFAVSTGLVHPKSIRSVELLEDEMVCIMRSDHPAASHPLTLKRFLALKHIRIVQTASDTRFVDEHLSREPRRQVALSIPHWLAAPALVESTDLVTAISGRMARSVNTHGRFAVRPLPVGPKSFSWRLYWHSRYDAHAAHKWMRELVQRTCAGLA